MTTVKRITDLTKYTNVLPYDSELFGVYQPLLGWRSIRQKERFQKGLQSDKENILAELQKQFSGVFDIQIQPPPKDSIVHLGNRIKINIKPGTLRQGFKRINDSVLLKVIVTADLPEFEDYDESIWETKITAERINSVLNNEVVGFYANETLGKTITSEVSDLDQLDPAVLSTFESQLEYESKIAGSLIYLIEMKNYPALEDIFYLINDNTSRAQEIINTIDANDGNDIYLNIENIDPTDHEQLKNVSLSPISVVHLFRQYFFELDTFLGTPEDHVWLPPGSSVEIISERTTKSTREETFESSFEVATKTERETQSQDDISDAIKEDNQKDLNLAGSVTAKYTKIEATASFDYKNSQSKSREHTHKKMRSQSNKLSSEIRKSYKTTFKTVDEYTEYDHTKHILANSGKELINYELRRKMRQIGVQVQDVGTYLCWQTFVDDPGKELGLSKLVHLAESPELNNLQHPEETPRLQTFHEDREISIPFSPSNNTNADKDEVYVLGVEADANSEGYGKGTLEKIYHTFPQRFVSPKPNHYLQNVEFVPTGAVEISLKKGEGIVNHASGEATFTIQLDKVNFQGADSITIKVRLFWSPVDGANDAIDSANAQKLDEFRAAEKRAYEEAFLETVKDRINAVSNISMRDRSDLREEERIVVYRQLIQGLLQKNIKQPDDRTRHVVSELIDSIFDVEKMLYFVAPEWWRPRLHRSTQQLIERKEKPPSKVVYPMWNAHNLTGSHMGRVINKSKFVAPNSPNATDEPNAEDWDVHNLTGSRVGRVINKSKFVAPENSSPTDEPSAEDSIDPATLFAANTAGWGEIDYNNRDSYYITDESKPAKFGSSLGWLLQLDGDNLRNAFLNAPWVKAVIPIRPGKEKAAINWLQAVEGMEGLVEEDSNPVEYHSNNPNETFEDGRSYDGADMLEVLCDLAEKIKKKHEDGLKKESYPKKSEVANPALVDSDNQVTSTPIDRVYEHGFYPLQNSFKANIDADGNEGMYEIFDQWIEILPTDQVVPVEVKYDPKTGRQV